jgi:hypothetical protein
VEAVGDAFVLSVIRSGAYKGGIFLLNHWKSQNYIYEQQITQRKELVEFMR